MLAPSPTRVLFVLKHPGYIWQYGYASVIRRLLDSGCEVVIGFTNTSKQDWLHRADLIPSGAGGTVRVVDAPVRGGSAPLNALRSLQDYRRYAAPAFLGANVLKWRARSFTSMRWINLERARSGCAAALERFWARLARMVPPDRGISRFLAEMRPDVVVLSQLVEFGSVQRDYVLACESLGIPSVYMVASWDNLSNKGDIAVRPTRILVWNEVQKQEAAVLHGIPEAEVEVCGAVPFEDFRDRRPSVDRVSQLRSLGLDPEAEYVVFLGSSNFICDSSEETAYVQSLAAAMARHPDPRISDKAIVIRPHPQSAAAWANIDLGKIGARCVLSRNEPNDEADAHDPAEGRQAFFDLLAHSSAAFGANTTAMIEASIVGVPVVSVETIRGQRETLHYYYLRTGVIASPQPIDALNGLLEVLDGARIPRLSEFPARFAFPKGELRPSQLVSEKILETAGSLVARRSGWLSHLCGHVQLLTLRGALTRDWSAVLAARLRVKYELGEQLGFQRSVRRGVPVALGLTAHNNAAFLREALTSILAQTYRDFMLVCVDDGSSDETQAILLEFSRKDARIHLVRNDERAGMVAAWRKAFDFATAVAPDARYFAWISDHDVWDRLWLERMVTALEARSDVVLAYPLTVMIDTAGNVRKRPARPPRFDTENTTDAADRVAYTARHLKGAGNMVYGLFRVAALRRAGVFRNVLLPDRLLMMDMASQGRLLQVDEVLWRRRVVGEASLLRQRHTLFTDGNRPRHVRLPWALQHAAGFALQQVRALRQVSGLSLPGVLRLALLVYVTQRAVEAEKSRAQQKRPQAPDVSPAPAPPAATAPAVAAAARVALSDWVDCLRARIGGGGASAGDAGRAELLFVGRRYMHLPYFESVFQQLLAWRLPFRILLDREWCAKDPEVARGKFEALLRDNPRARFAWARRRARTPLRELLFSARELRAYLSYEARKGVSEYYVERWWNLLTPEMKARFGKRWFARLARTWPFRTALALLERLTPPDPAIVRELLRRRPRVVFVSPLVQRFSEEVEYVKAARFLGIPSAALVLSWDTLSTKGLIHVRPDRLLVWNGHHRRQAMRIHGIPASRIDVVGAPFFDRWFEERAADGPEAVRTRWRIPAPRYILYLGSSANIARDESWFVEQLADAVAGREALAGVSLVVRPHPANREVFRRIDRTNVVLTDSDGSLPNSEREHRDFASLMKSAICCVGVNTSAMLDAVFAGAAVATVLLDRYAATQEKAEHFRILAEAGCLQVFANEATFVDWAAGLADGGGGHGEAQRRFVLDFARPHGAEVSAAEMCLRAVGMVPAQGGEAAGPQSRPELQRIGRRRQGMSQTRLGSELRRHLEERERSEVYEAYLWARDHVLRMLDDEETRLPEVSEYWRQELDGFRYMLDASPLIVDRLREHCHHITGIKSYDYREHHAHKAAPQIEKLRQLRQLDAHGLFVPESPALGGFGYRTPEGDLINIDTLKFYEVLIGLDRSGFLERAGLRDQDGASGGKRPAILEIGSGWGGFAFAFKSLFPQATYICLDLPQTMIFSLTYLKSVFPDASILVVDSDEAARGLDAHGAHDFIFLPHHRLEALRAVPLAGCINMVSFQEMTTANVRAYAEFLHGHGCPQLYSLNRDRSAHNANLSSVSEILSACYDLSERDVLTLPYTNFGPLPEPGRTKGIHDYRHLSGIRKALG